MAREVIRHPHSLPLSSYNIAGSGYRGHIVLPGYVPKDSIPGKINVSTPLVKFGKGEEPAIKLRIPLVSAAMQSVSGHDMAIALARMGGLSVIFCSQRAEEQAQMVRMVKRHKGAFIEPEVLSPDHSLAYVAERMRATGYSKFFVTEDGNQHGRLLGIITNNDFDERIHAGFYVRDRMLPLESMDIVYDDEVGYDISKASSLMMHSHHSALPIIHRDGRLRDVIFKKDVKAREEYESELVDEKKRLMVAAAVNTHDYAERVPAVAEAGADVIFIDTSQGYSDYVKDAVKFIREKYPRIPVVGGNIVTAEGFDFLVKECGADAVKVGMGIGSICITPEQIGIARGQDKAIEDVAKARDEYFAETGIYVPIVADGGIRSVRDMLVALALGADAVMLGRFLAGTDESPTQVNFSSSPPKKPYWGEGSDRAKRWREKRGYNPGFDEGVEGWINYVGPLRPFLTTAIMQLKDGIRKAGCSSIHELHKNAVVESISEHDAAPSVLQEK